MFSRIYVGNFSSLFKVFVLYMKGGEQNPVQLDHCYAKPWNWRQEMAHCKPARILFAEENFPVWCVGHTLYCGFCN